MRVIVKTLIFTVFVPGSVTVGGPYLLLSSDVELLSYEIGDFRLIGIFPIALGTVFYIWCAWDFAVGGKGTPAPFDPPKMLVSRGLYRMVRNPMHVGVLLILVGEAIAFESLALFAYAILVGSSFHLFVVYYEQPNLKGKFRAPYEEYCKVVPRWIPGIRCAKGMG